MTSAPVAPLPRPSPRPLLGLRSRPGKLALVMLRMPVRAYEHDKGHLLGRTFLELSHTGRRTGKPYQAVAMVLRDDRTTGEAVIAAAWGPDTDWYQNLQKRPATAVRIGHDSFTPEQQFLTETESFEVASRFRGAHPHRLRLFSRVLAWGDLDDDENLRDFVRRHPFVAFRPRSGA